VAADLAALDARLFAARDGLVGELLDATEVPQAEPQD
jgi:hypothetical protein